MMFDHNLFDSYRTLLQSTDLQRAYQEFIRWFDLVYHKDKMQDEEFKRFLKFCESLDRENLEKLMGNGMKK